MDDAAARALRSTRGGRPSRRVSRGAVSRVACAGSRALPSRLLRVGAHRTPYKILRVTYGRVRRAEIPP